MLRFQHVFLKFCKITRIFHEESLIISFGMNYPYQKLNIYNCLQRKHYENITKNKNPEKSRNIHPTYRNHE